MATNNVRLNSESYQRCAGTEWSPAGTRDLTGVPWPRVLEQPDDRGLGLRLRQLRHA